MDITCRQRARRLHSFVFFPPGSSRGQSGGKDPEQMRGKNPQIQLGGDQGRGENLEKGKVEEEGGGKTRKETRME